MFEYESKDIDEKTLEDMVRQAPQRYDKQQSR